MYVDNRMKDIHKIHVYLEGVEQFHCFRADDILGYVLVEDENPRQLASSPEILGSVYGWRYDGLKYDNVPAEIKFGRVEIRIYE